MTIRRLSAAAFAAVPMVLALAPAAHAQQTGRGFLFGAPVGTLALRGGWAGASATGDLFDFTREHLTLERRDFGSFTGGADFAVRVRSRTDIVVSASMSGTTRRSEFRAFVEEGPDGDMPIEQDTRFQRAPLTLSVKQYLMPRGRSVGTLAWIPAPVAPWVGAGGGAAWYRFHQQGDFVDFETNEIHTLQLETSGWAPTAHVMAGLDVSLTPRLALVSDARYTWSRGTPGRDFLGFDRIDLSGFTATAGLAIRY
jgi:hypothetical protein